MPAKSKAQEEYLAINKPEVLDRWKAEGADLSTKGLPNRVGGSKPRGQRRRLAKMLRRAR